MTDRELFKMALNALEYAWGKKQQEAIESLRAALAQPEIPNNLPVANLKQDELMYPAQPEQIISQEWQPANPDAKLRHYSLVLRDLDKTIEGWCEQPEFYLDGKRIDVERLQQWSLVMKDGQKVPMDLTHREWQGLTIEERTDIRRRIQEYTPMDDIKYGEAVQFFTEEALKEKNA